MSQSASTYRAAIRRTAETLEDRARTFRNQIVLVVAVVGVSILSAAIVRAAWPLAGVLLLFPLSGWYAFVDGILLARWRGALYSWWTSRELELAAFRGAIEAIPTLPAETLQSMLATLPPCGTLPEEQRLSSATRRAITNASEEFYRASTDLILLRTAVSAVVVVSIVAATGRHDWRLFLGVAALGPMLLARSLIRRMRAGQRVRRLEVTRASPEFDEEDYTRVMSHLE